jgi:beta-lactamase superfamily II metal-dependent hydrolase
VAEQKHVAVRMYNVGFGDAFLLLFPGNDRPRRVLIDCGMHSIGPGPKPMSDVVQRIIDHCRDADGESRIDVVIGTHRHQDHVRGFASKKWDRVRVSEVWMPWTEHPTDNVARSIRESQSKRAGMLKMALTRLGADDMMMSMAENSLTNYAAMHTLHQGFRGVRERRFLPDPKTAPRTFRTKVLPDVAIHVLGPSRNKDVIREMEPDEGESYLTFRLGRNSRSGTKVHPFRAEWAMRERSWKHDFKHLRFTRQHLRAIENIGSGTEFELLAQLEKAVNGTSLMLMFVVGRAHLLFSGDAQWGTWTAALADPQWSELLSKTSFYKIGHHGSHNATPPNFVEKHLSKTFKAMASTRPVRKWPDIPRKPLLDALRKRSNRVVRSDCEDVPDPEGFVRGDGYVETKVAI